MKSKLIFSVLIMLIAFISSCQKQVNDSSESMSSNILSEKSFARKAVAADINKEVYDQIVANNNARLALLNNDVSRGGCVQTAIVPDDYLTIQEAMDAVCKNGTIIVNKGYYSEDVLIDKSGLRIIANGDVTVNGCFFLYSNLNKVEIQNFKINPDGPSDNGYNGIYGYGLQGGKIMQNIIRGIGTKGYGIVLENSNGVTIKQNQVSDFEWGIVFKSVNGLKSSSHNIIEDNTVTGITYASCIGLDGDCDNNLIMGNLVTENTSTVNAGIFCYNYISDGILTDNNIIKNNEVTFNEWTGIWIDGGKNNVIGPNNICNNSNTDIGIYLSYAVTKTKVFNNTALYNGYCDFVYEEGADFTLKYNTFNCIEMW